MRRNVDLNEISDGKLYTSNDMVKVLFGKLNAAFSVRLKRVFQST